MSESEETRFSLEFLELYIDLGIQVIGTDAVQKILYQRQHRAEITRKLKENGHGVISLEQVAELGAAVDAFLAKYGPPRGVPVIELDLRDLADDEQAGQLETVEVPT